MPARRCRSSGAVGTQSIGLLGSSALSGDDAGAEDAPLVVEISEDMSRFVFDDAPVFDDGLPPTATRS